jgi:phage terminase large subunit-like protein
MTAKPTQQKNISQASIDPVTQYSKDARDGRIIAGPLVRLAGERHLRDLAEGSKRGLRWDREAAQRAIDFFPDVLRLAEGEHAGKPFILQPWQQFIVGSLFGWKSSDGFRRFRNAYVEVGKGNGKSPLAGGIGLYMLCADGEISAECYAAATSRDQANILFRDAVRMVEASPALAARILKSGSRHVFNLAHTASGSYFRPVSSEKRGLDGKRVHFAAIDELHEHPNSIVVDKMRAGTKARRQALIFRITNSGFDLETVCGHEHEYSQKIVERILEDDSWFSFVCCFDEGDEWTDEKNWIKPNPNLGVSIQLKYLREQVTEALGMPSKQNTVKRLNFCVWTSGASAAIDPNEWRKCAGFSLDGKDPRKLRAEIEEQLAGRRCFIALDLSSTEDLTAEVKLFPPEGKDDLWIAIPHFWLPQANIDRKVKELRVPYDVWVREGWIVATEGDVVDYDAPLRQVMADLEQYRVAEITFDPWNSTQFANDLQKQGVAVELLTKFKQVLELFNEPTKKLLEVLIPKRKIAHLGNPVLSWNASNLVVWTDPNGSMRPTKRSSRGKIDGMVALIMALGRAISNTGSDDDGRSVYETRGIVSL